VRAASMRATDHCRTLANMTTSSPRQCPAVARYYAGRGIWKYSPFKGEPKIAAVILDDRPRNGKSQSHSGRFRRKKRIKY
jgi:hypothetical protein